MKETKITKSNVEEALEQIDLITEISIKERGCLRLLTEEMFSMCHELLGTNALDFELKQDGRRCTLSGSTKTQVDEEAKAHLLSASSSGKNAANKGVMGILGAVLELFSIDCDPKLYNATLGYGMHGMHGMDDSYRYMWSISRYMDAVVDSSNKPEWDGLEKSIIANFADDVSIGVRSGKLQMTITKTF